MPNQKDLSDAKTFIAILRKLSPESKLRLTEFLQTAVKAGKTAHSRPVRASAAHKKG